MPRGISTTASSVASPASTPVPSAERYVGSHEGLSLEVMFSEPEDLLPVTVSAYVKEELVFDQLKRPKEAMSFSSLTLEL